MLRHFQDDTFVVEHACGDVILDLLGFSERGPSQPEKLLLRFEHSGWCSCFLSAFIAHWDSLADSDVDDVLQDYADIPRIDYSEHWPIRGACVRSITCVRSAGRTSLAIATDTGTIVLREVDGSDPHTDSELLWHPRPAG